MHDDTVFVIDTQEGEYIDIDDFNDMRYWSNRFNVAKWRIREAVLEVGDSAPAVEEQLRRGARPRRTPHRVFYLEAPQSKRTY
jgi:hypothetical protein